MDWIRERLQSCEDEVALIEDDRQYLYSDFMKHIQEWTERLQRDNVKEKEVVAIFGEFCAEMLFSMFALIQNGNIVVPISLEKKENLESMLKVARADKIYSFQAETIAFENLKNSQSHELIEQLRKENATGIMIFTSGSTGEGKCAIHKFSNLIYKARKQVKRKALKSLVFLKMDHIGGINTIFSVLFQAGTMVLIKDRSIKKVCSLIEKNQVELLPTTPSFINMLIISGAVEEYDLSSLKLITYGTEPMPTTTLQTISQLMPNVKIRQTYGLTEIGIFSTKSKDNSSTWMKIGGDEVEVEVRNHILFVRSPYAMLGYLNAPTPFDEEGWYNTNDEVEVDGEYFHIMGRKEEIINVGGEKVFPVEIEGVLAQLPNVLDVVVQGKKNPVTGQIVTALFQLIEDEDEKAFKKRVIEYCKKELEPYKIPRIICISDKNFIGTNLKKKRL